MPSRLLTLSIVLFWFAMMTILFFQEVLPSLRPNAAPPYTIDLVDEAKSQQSQVRWLVYLDGTKPESNMVAKTEVKYNEKAGYRVTEMALDAARFDGVPDIVRAKLSPMKDHLYADEAGFVAALSGVLSRRERDIYQAALVHRAHELHDDSFTFSIQLNCDTSRPPPGRFHAQQGLPAGDFAKVARGLAIGSITLRTMSSYYRVTHAGQLLSIEVDFHFDVTLPIAGQKIRDVEVHLDGDVVEGEFRARAELWAAHLGQREQQLKPVKMTHSGSVLMPMHPVNRIKGLRRGQQWRMPLVNPLADAVSATLAAYGLGVEREGRELSVRVLPRPQLLPDVANPPSCLVIEYDDEEIQPRTWVQEGTGLVLRQEATLMPGARLIMQRETINQEQ